MRSVDVIKIPSKDTREVVGIMFDIWLMVMVKVMRELPYLTSTSL